MKTRNEEHKRAVMKADPNNAIAEHVWSTRSSGMRQQALTMMETGSEGGSRKHCTLEAPMP